MPLEVAVKYNRLYNSINQNTTNWPKGTRLYLGSNGLPTEIPPTDIVVTVGIVTEGNTINGSVLYSIEGLSFNFRNQFEQVVNNTVETTFRSNINVDYAPVADQHVTNKKYVDEAVANLSLYQGGWNPNTNTPDLTALSPINGWTFDITESTSAPIAGPRFCTPTVIQMVKGDKIKYFAGCWLYEDREYPEATTLRSGTVTLGTDLNDIDLSDVATIGIVKSVSETLTLHRNDRTNPHTVTSSQIRDANAHPAIGTIPNATQSEINTAIDTQITTGLTLKADKLNGADQITDSNSYAELATIAGATQKVINTAINSKLGTVASTTNVVHKAGVETITGVKTFTALPATALAPVAGNDLANKTYVDTKQGALTLSTSGSSNLATFSNNILTIPQTNAAGTPSAVTGNISATTVQAALSELDLEKANDANVVHLVGTETISGTKTFTTVPSSTVAPTTNDHITNKAYIDTKQTVFTLSTSGNSNLATFSNNILTIP